MNLEAAGEHELRPEIFRMATARGWVLWELRRERATLEQVFRELTMDPASSAPAEAADAEVAPSGSADAPAGEGNEK